MNRKIYKATTLIFVLAILCTALLPTSVAFATQYGVKDSSDLETFWYYGESHLNVAEMKESISKWITKADKNNPILIGVIDTGINVNHEVFEKTNTIYKVDGKAQGFNSFVGTSKSGIKNPTADQLAYVTDETSSSHGTAVASIMAMLIKELGLEDFIKIYPIKATRNRAMVSGDNIENELKSFPTEAVVNGLKYVMDTQDTLGIDVVNLALAGYDAVATEYINAQNTFTNLSSNCVLVAAAGNESAKSSEKPCYPASLDGVVSVMAYGKDGSKIDSSNYGKYDLIAPGQEIYVAKGSSDSYGYEGGTSMATAFVSVVSAVVKLREQTAQNYVDGNVIARHILTSSTKVVNYGVYQLTKFDGYASINEQLSETYLEPTGITVTNNQDLGKESTVYRGEYSNLVLTANLLPLGNTDPKLTDNIIWTQTEILSKPVVDRDGNETDEVEEYDGNTIELGKGREINYTPSIAGKYRVSATYKHGDTTFVESMIFTIKYVQYSSVAGMLEVKPTSLDENGTIEDGFIYELDTVKFYLENSQGLDPTKEIKWFVNGEYAHTGETFSYKFTKQGEYVISAQYGDYREVEKVYTIQVKSGFLRPAVWISFTAVVSALVIAGTALGIVSAKKKAQQKTQE